jgi:hypothetical protein
MLPEPILRTLSLLDSSSMDTHYFQDVLLPIIGSQDEMQAVNFLMAHAFYRVTWSA